jgi:hypothetical protein
MKRSLPSTVWPFLTSLLMGTTAFADTKVMLPDTEKFTKVGRDFMVQTTIPGDFKTPEGVVAALLTLGDQAAGTGLTVPFFPSTTWKHTPGGSPLRPLASYFRGARLDGETIIVSFSSDALRYLNGAAARQEQIKGSIEGTLLLNFPTAKKVEYEIDGKLFSDWDA